MDNKDIRPVLWGVSGFLIGESFRRVASEFAERVRLEVINAHSDEAVDIVSERLRHEHCDALISAGANAAYIRERLPLPVIAVRIGGFDIMDAMAQARRVSDKIGVVLHTTAAKDLRAFAKAFSLNVEFRYYYTMQEGRNAMGELAALGIKAIVGAGAVVTMAEDFGMVGFFVYTLDSVRLGIEDALSIISAKMAERSRHTLLHKLGNSFGH